MKEIREALELTGKVGAEEEGRNYAKIRPCGVLSWFDKARDIFVCDVRLDDILNYTWHPFPEVKEIIPEKAGELWISDKEYYHTEDHTSSGCGLCLVGYGSKGFKEVDNGNTSHGKNGWIRLFPPVEDDSVERIELKDIEMESCFDDIIIKTSALDGGTVFNKIRGNVTIELPKGLTKHP